MDVMVILLLVAVVIGVQRGAQKIQETRQGLRPGVQGEHGICWWLFR